MPDEMKEALRLLELASFYIIEKPKPETCNRWNREYEKLKSDFNKPNKDKD